MHSPQALIAQLIAEWTPTPGNVDDPLAISLNLEGAPAYLPLLQAKHWYSRYGRRRQAHRVLGLNISGEWVEDGPAKGRVSRTFGSAAECFSDAWFALRPLKRARERYPALRDLIWNEVEVAQIEERYLSKWKAEVDALQDDETRDDEWLRRHDLLSGEAKLGFLETPRTLSALVAALRAPTANVRQRAVRGLGCTIPGRGLEREVIALADDASATVRTAVAQALGSIGTRETLPILLAYLRDEPAIGVVAISALVSQGLPEAREEIVRIATSAEDTREDHADDATVSLQMAATLALQTFWAPGDAETLVLLCKVDAPAVREVAAFVLGEMRVDTATADLERLLWDPMPQVRSSAAWALGTLGRDEFIPRFVELAQSDSDYFYDPVTQNYEHESSIALETMLLMAQRGSARARAAYDGLRLSFEAPGE
jgi:hypothetical protein